ncbi:hypothetical protein NX774_15890 [Massilia agilis]|uniref:PDZ domain-containing protein n=1 Tax=Massilia agilis TaxID=1811226 RepID=A0ABT2DDL5_9BURK|nr:hypothetical protein [Massilia agilis]MCS0809405.1 hypothetical protein [Massilia agilis]
MKRMNTVVLAALLASLLAGCGTARLTVDDGRQLDPYLLSEMRTYGAGARAVRPAIVRSAALHDKGCSHQYELPFEAMTSYGLANEDQKVAWARTLGVNERLSVIAADRSSGLARGDVIAQVDGYTSRNSLKLLQALRDARDQGDPFRLVLAGGRAVTVAPLRVCRGHVVLASPFRPQVQNYHWRYAVHPLEVFQRPLTGDEAQWIVLWTQGLSERGGARMKTYAFLMGGLKWATVFALGATASSAAASSRSASAAAGSSSAGQAAAAQLAGQAGSMAARSAADRATLSGISRVAAGVFDRADAWAFENMIKLGMNPRAGLTLHEKLLGQGLYGNAFVLDDERLAAMRVLTEQLPEAPRAAAASPGRR